MTIQDDGRTFDIGTPRGTGREGIVLCEEEQGLEGEELTRTIRREKMQQIPERTERTKEIEREKREQQENTPPREQPAQSKPEPKPEPER